MLIQPEIEKTFFRNTSDIQKIAEENPEYTKIYINRFNNDGKLSLSLSKEHGDELYIVSNKDHEDLKLYFKNENIDSISKKLDNKTNIKKVQSETSKDPIIKKAKQNNLFSFITKKK